MGLRCSVLGHDYGETGVERERDERGEEVVRTAKRVRTCRRCGHERTVTENTEITALEPEAGVVRDSDGRVVAATAEENVAADGTGTITIEGGALDDASEDRAEPLDDPDAATGGATGTIGTAENGETPDEPDDPDETPMRDDEVIETVNDAPADNVRGRAPGEWPAPPNEGATTRPGDGSAAGSLTPVDDAANAANAASDPKPLSNGWPVETGEPPAEDSTDAGANAPAGVERPGETFACRACGFTAAVADSPLRAGDICPECRAGYLARGTRKG